MDETRITRGSRTSRDSRAGVAQYSFRSPAIVSGWGPVGLPHAYANAYANADAYAGFRPARPCAMLGI